MSRIRSDQDNKEILSLIQSHILDLKDKVMDIDERVISIEETLKKKNQPVDDVIHPIRELVHEVVEIRKANANVVSGMNTIQQMIKAPRNFACIPPDSEPSMPYEPLIKHAPLLKKRTVGRKPTDKPEDRADLSKPTRTLTKLEKLRLVKARDINFSRDPSPCSAAGSERSGISSAVDSSRKTTPIPDYTLPARPSTLEAIPKNPLQTAELHTVKQNKDIFRSAHFQKLAQMGIPVQSIEKEQALLPQVMVKTIDNTIKWLKEHSKYDWDLLRDKMLESFVNKGGEEKRAIPLYNVAALTEDYEIAIQYLSALKEAKLAFWNLSFFSN